MIELVLAASATALATGLGVIPVWLLGARAEGLRPALLGLAAGVMAVASVLGLLVPGFDDGSPEEVLAGLALGVAFLFVARRFIDHRRFGHGHGHGHGLGAASFRTSLLVFLVLLVHSLPEGFAIGTAYASDTTGLALFVFLAIAIQNVPEGTAVAIPMEAAGYGFGRQFWAAVGTSLPQPIGAVIAYLLVEEVSQLLPVSFGFAAGAMLALVAVELAPQALRASPKLALTGGAAGALVMIALSYLLGV